ncbi:penicillin-binding protein 2 [Schnuerera sp. xch1]|uniref:peptidoglycan D,D-transpeptidase FtsI family protein n=1 Tax=Schnuerera sp. xch1 TaxID=2874283 RepID=UPI001CBB4CDD|nr:penicillin-binding protein 2 [Schnuerera sp. xch1]MBZ2173723.1 penicillin-binding protein 2 [Schnuerera sp. xch1]
MRRNKNNIIHNRILKMVFISFFVFIALIGRLYWIQIESHDTLKEEALKQRGRKVDLYPDRGTIYDVNLIPITNRNRINILFVFRNSIMNNKDLKNYIVNNSVLDKSDLERYIYSRKELLFIPLKPSAEDISNNKNMFITEMTLRYSDENLLSHVIGYINDSENRGEAGIEKVYDDILKNQGNVNSLYLELDTGKNIFLGGEYVSNQRSYSMEPGGVKLTIDYHIQKVVEDILDQREVNGAAVVADVQSGDIRALASRPNIDQNDIDKYLNRDDMALYNKAVQVAYPPGSLFKIVVLLTALENDMSLLDRIYYCNGFEQIGNVIINCNNLEGHGYIDLSQAFMKSCNSVFIQLGQELGSKKIIEMARKLGLGEKVNIGLPEEVAGNIPGGKELQGPVIGNISIGQGSIETTPIQLTNLMMIIANDGIKKGLAVVDGITTQDGQMIKKFIREKETRVVSKESCQILKEYLVGVVNEGTAKNLDLDNIGGAGGKTGSAQAILNGEETTHGWFTGFFPAEDPKYVVTIFVEEGISGSQSAVPIFEQIIREIYKIGR